MNCSFCARDGVASAEAPNSAASAIPTCFPFIGSSIETPEMATRGAATPAPGHNCRGLNMDPGAWLKVSDLPQLGSDLPRQARRIAERPRTCRALNVFRPHQLPWPPHALTFKLKMHKPREHLDGYRYWNRSTGGLVAVAVREGFAGFWDHDTRTQKASTAACFVRLPGASVPSAGHAPFEVLRQRFGLLQVCRLADALVPFAAPAPFKVLHQRLRFPQVRCVKAFCELLVDCLHQL